MERLKFVVSMLLVMLMFLSVVEVSAETHLGVKVGDWAKYRDTCVWSSEDPGATEPDYVKGINDTEWRTLRVQAVSGTSVTVAVTRHFRNGTEKTDTYLADMATGERDNEFGFQIVPAHLAKDDTVWLSALRINYTESKEYAGANREVNYAGMTIPIEGVTIFEYYWDKETGVLCATATLDTVFSGGYKTTTWIETKMIETNMWQAETEPPPAGIQWWQPVIVVAAISVAILLIKKKRKPKKRRK